MSAGSPIYQGGIRDGFQEQWRPDREAYALRLGAVVGVHWEDHTVDVAWPNGGGRTHIPVAEAWAGSDYGDIWTPPAPDAAPTATTTVQARRDTLAIVGYLNGSTASPIVLCFVYPEVSGMMLKDLQRYTRYVGDSFAGVTQDGDQYLAYDRDGSYLGFHAAGSGMPPTMVGADYDRQSQPAHAPRGFTMRLADGTVVRLDERAGDLTLHAARATRLSGAERAEIGAPTTTIEGLAGLFLGGMGGWHAGFVYAPETHGTATVAHLTNNAGYDTVTPLKGDGAPRDWSGWRYLQDGPAARVELGSDGHRHAFAAPAGAKGDRIAWAAVAEAAAPYKVPPPEPQYLSFDFQATGHLSWVCGAAITFTGARVDGVGTIACALNGAAVATPSSVAPLALAPGDVLRLDATGVTVGGDLLVTLVAAPTALPDYATAWYTVHTDLTPPTVTAPAP